MAVLTVKIVGIEEDSVLVKYATENSALPIDEYDAVAYQPAAMGYSSVDAFLEGIKPGLLSMAEARDRKEAGITVDMSDWIGKEVKEVIATQGPAGPSQRTPQDDPEVEL